MQDRRVRRAPQIHKVRRVVKLSLRSRGLDGPVLAFCQRYGFVDDDGTPRQAEALRVLMYVALLRGSRNRVAVTVEAAVRSAKPMIVAQMAKRLTRTFATADEIKQEKKHDRDWGGTAKVTFDDWLYRALTGNEMRYRGPTGIVDDMRMVADATRAGLADPDLGQIARLYGARLVPMRRALAAIEDYTRKLLVQAIGKELPLVSQSRSA